MKDSDKMLFTTVKSKMSIITTLPTTLCIIIFNNKKKKSIQAHYPTELGKVIQIFYQFDEETENLPLKKTGEILNSKKMLFKIETSNVNDFAWNLTDCRILLISKVIVIHCVCAKICDQTSDFYNPTRVNIYGKLMENLKWKGSNFYGKQICS